METAAMWHQLLQAGVDVVVEHNEDVKKMSINTTTEIKAVVKE